MCATININQEIILSIANYKGANLFMFLKINKKNNKAFLYLFISVSLFICFYKLYYNYHFDDLLISLHLTNRTCEDLEDFTIFINYKSNKKNDIKLLNNSIIKAHDIVKSEKNINPHDIFSIDIIYRTSKQSIFYNAVNNIEKININLSIDNKKPFILSGMLYDGKKEYSIDWHQ